MPRPRWQLTWVIPSGIAAWAKQVQRPAVGPASPASWSYRWGRIGTQLINLTLKQTTGLLTKNDYKTGVKGTQGGQLDATQT